MKTVILLLALIVGGCVVSPYEPEEWPYYIGYYNPGYGYWTGTGWDLNFYAYGHSGYGHYYRGAPGYARGYYRDGHGHR